MCERARCEREELHADQTCQVLVEMVLQPSEDFDVPGRSKKQLVDQEIPTTHRDVQVCVSSTCQGAIRPRNSAALTKVSI